MKRQKTKTNFSISIDNKLYKILEAKFFNKSTYIEWLIQQDLIKNNVRNVKNLIL